LKLGTSTYNILLLLETAFLTKNLKLKKFEGKKKGFLSFYSVCMFVCLIVCRRSRDFIVQHMRLNILHRYLEYLKMVSFTFFNFPFFSELYPFFVFYYFLYFMPASQHIMTVNTSNWSLGLGECIMCIDTDISLLWRHRITSWIFENITNASYLTFWVLIR